MLNNLFFLVENSEQSEAKGLFETNFSHIYHILYDTFLQAETNLRQRGKLTSKCNIYLFSFYYKKKTIFSLLHGI